MVANATPPRERVFALLNELTDAALPDVISFLEFQRYKQEQAGVEPKRPRPVKMGGIWAGVEITDEDIAEVRREMWEGFGERDL